MFLQRQRLCRCDKLRTGGGEGTLDCPGGPQTLSPVSLSGRCPTNIRTARDCRGRDGWGGHRPRAASCCQKRERSRVVSALEPPEAPPCWPCDFSPQILTSDGWPPAWERMRFCCLKSPSVWRPVIAAPGSLWRSGDTQWGHSSQSRGPTCPGNKEGQWNPQASPFSQLQGSRSSSWTLFPMDFDSHEGLGWLPGGGDIWALTVIP